MIKRLLDYIRQNYDRIRNAKDTEAEIEKVEKEGCEILNGEDRQKYDNDTISM